MNRKDQQYNTNFWSQFIDKKTKQFYDNFYKQDSTRSHHYLVIMTILQSVILFSIKKETRLQQFNSVCLTTLIFGVISLLLVKRKPKTQNIASFILNIMTAFDILTIDVSFQFENEIHFALKLIIIIFVLPIRNLVNYNSWVDQIKQSLVLYLVLIPGYLIFQGQLSLGKIQLLLLCGIFGQAFIFISLSLFEQRLKKIWGNYDILRKSQKTQDQLLFELPVPILIVNREGSIQMQNYLAYRVVPKDIDLITKKYTNNQLTINELLISPDDIIRFKESINKAFENDDLEYLEIVLSDYPYPQLCYFQKITWKRQQSILVTFVEIGDFQQYLFQNFGPNSQYSAKNSTYNNIRSTMGKIEDNKSIEVSMNSEQKRKRSASWNQIQQDNYPQKNSNASINLMPRKHQTVYNIIQEENSKIYSEDDRCSIKEKRHALKLQSVSNVFSECYVALPKIIILSEEEKKNYVTKKSDPKPISSPSLSPIPILFDKKFNRLNMNSVPFDRNRIHQDKQKQFDKIDNKEAENYDVDEKINKYMHYIEKGVSKTLENILSEIMTYKGFLLQLSQGKKLKIKFQSSKKKNVKNFETSPENSNEILNQEYLSYCSKYKSQDQIRKSQSQEHFNKPSIFRSQQKQNSQTEEDIKADSKLQDVISEESKQYSKQEIPPQIEFPSVIEKLQRQQPKQVKNNKISSLFSKLREEKDPNIIIQVTIPSSTSQLVLSASSLEFIGSIKDQDQENGKSSPVFNRTSTSRTSVGFIFEEPSKPIITATSDFSFQKIASPVQKRRSLNQDLIVEAIEEKSISEEVSNECSLDIKSNSIDVKPNLIDIKPKFAYCDTVTMMIVDDFVFVLNSVGAMKLNYERVLKSSNKGIDAIEQFKQHLSQGFLFHLLLIDFDMGAANWTGYKLVSEIRQYEQEIGAPRSFIIGLDNDLTDIKLQQAIEKGYDHAIEKPLNPPMINSFIASVLENIKK